MSLKLNILTPEWGREETVQAVFLPGALCPFEVLPGHAPIVSTLSAGTVRWRLTDGTEDSVAIRGGVARVLKDVVELCIEV